MFSADDFGLDEERYILMLSRLSNDFGYSSTELPALLEDLYSTRFAATLAGLIANGGIDRRTLESFLAGDYGEPDRKPSKLGPVQVNAPLSVQQLWGFTPSKLRKK